MLLEPVKPVKNMLGLRSICRVPPASVDVVDDDKSESDDLFIIQSFVESIDYGTLAKIYDDNQIEDGIDEAKKLLENEMEEVRSTYTKKSYSTS